MFLGWDASTKSNCGFSTNSFKSDLLRRFRMINIGFVKSNLNNNDPTVAMLRHLQSGVFEIAGRKMTS